MFLSGLVLLLLCEIGGSLVPIKKVYFAGDILPVEIGPNQNLAGHSPSSVQFCQNTFQMAMTTQLPTEPRTKAMLLPKSSKFFGTDLIVGLTRGYVMYIPSPFTSNPVLIFLSTPYAVDTVVGVPGTQNFFAGTEQGIHFGSIDSAVSTSLVQPLPRVQSLHVRPQKPHELLTVSFSWVQLSLHVTNTTVGRYRLQTQVAYASPVFIPFSPVSIVTLAATGQLEVLAMEVSPPFLYSQTHLLSPTGAPRGVVHVPNTDLLLVAFTDALEILDVYSPGGRRFREALSVVKGISLWNDAFQNGPFLDPSFGSPASSARASIVSVTFENSDVQIFYLDKECPVGCQNCRYLAEKQQVICDECLPGFRFTDDSSLCVGICSSNPDATRRLELDGSCIYQCPSGYWRSVDNCFKCDKTCLECIGPAPGRCKKCNDLNVLSLRGSCNYECGNSEYLTSPESRECSPCQPNCIRCRNDTSAVDSKLACDLCANRFALLPSLIMDICKPDCQSGEYFDASINECSKCSPGCKKCNSANSAGCSECQTGYINHLGSCLSRCPEGFFSSRDLKSCVPCIDNCAQCGTARECMICKSGYLRSAKTLQCSKTCPSEEGFYIQDNKFCNPCDTACQTCDGRSTSCTSCRPGYELRLGACWQSGLWKRLLQRWTILGVLAFVVLIATVVICKNMRASPPHGIRSVRLPSSEDTALNSVARLQTTHRDAPPGIQREDLPTKLWDGGPSPTRVLDSGALNQLANTDDAQGEEL